VGRRIFATMAVQGKKDGVGGNAIYCQIGKEVRRVKVKAFLEGNRGGGLGKGKDGLAALTILRTCAGS